MFQRASSRSASRAATASATAPADANATREAVLSASVGADGTATQRASRRVRRVLAGLIAAVIVLFIARVVLGDPVVYLDQLWLILTGETVPGLSFIVTEHRGPAAVVGALAGAALGLSGTIFQTLLRNPLASPDVIGVGYGAATAAVAGMLALGITGPALSLFAFAGGLVVALFVYFMAESGKNTGGRFILIGIGAAAMLQAVMNYLLTRTDVRAAGDALHWLVGSLSSSTWDRAAVLAACLVVLAPLTALAVSKLRILELGDDAATSLGLNVRGTRAALVVLGVALSACTIAVTGPLAFVAFLAGPLARLLTHRTNFVASALVGAALVLAADFAGANLFGDVTLPAGVITGALGAPFLLWLLVRSNKQGMGG
ncbi:FecCD family ABC transporter permease [Zhihengliuella flava]|uniref:Iron complex transport system permease protein n=1 Tax=Zhihengliuella flava TaxID=1285193 RepID=A0A931GEM4_9MICC|nr:iron chelate uptake ABC transporter family permease subunit [Zhihengliuella flava]MBG6084275.1 iron complex transport system permease protein [Zhihengliuella flava]